ncbi:hypothetical protein ACR3K2_33930 [Cryptosporidium serpentis]
MEIRNIDYDSLQKPLIKQSFYLGFTNLLANGMNISSQDINIIKIWKVSNLSLRRNKCFPIGIKVNINVYDYISSIKKFKQMLEDNEIPFNNVFNTKVLSINLLESNINKSKENNEYNTIIGYDSKHNSKSNLKTVPITISLEIVPLDKIKDEIEIKNKLQYYLAISLNSSSIQLVQFSARLKKKLNSSLISVINTDILIYPEENNANSVILILNNLYANIINGQNSAFSNHFKCIGYKIKNIPRAKNSTIYPLDRSTLNTSWGNLMQVNQLDLLENIFKSGNTYLSRNQNKNPNNQQNINNTVNNVNLNPNKYQSYTNNSQYLYSNNNKNKFYNGYTNGYLNQYTNQYPAFSNSPLASTFQPYEYLSSPPNDFFSGNYLDINGQYIHMEEYPIHHIYNYSDNAPFNSLNNQQWDYTNYDQSLDNNQQWDPTNYDQSSNNNQQWDPINYDQSLGNNQQWDPTNNDQFFYT